MHIACLSLHDRVPRPSRETCWLDVFSGASATWTKIETLRDVHSWNLPRQVHYFFLLNTRRRIFEKKTMKSNVDIVASIKSDFFKLVLLRNVFQWVDTSFFNEWEIKGCIPTLQTSIPSRMLIINFALIWISYAIILMTLKFATLGPNEKYVFLFIVC